MMDDDTKKREPGCDCPQEEGDSSRPVHGLEEDADVAHFVSEVERLKAKVAELEASRNGIVAKLREAIELAGEMMPYVDEYFRKKWGFWDVFGALSTYHASLTQELPPELPAPGRDRDTPRRPTVDRMDAAPARDERLDRPEDGPGHVCEVGGCPECDKAARERDERAKLYQCTPCLTWQEPEYGGRCRACGGSKKEHEGRA